MVTQVHDLSLAPPRRRRRRMTEAAFHEWIQPGVRAEWVDGEVTEMSPVSFGHTDMNGWLLSLLRTWVEDNDLGIVAGSEFHVRLTKQRSRRNPDVLFVAADRIGIVHENYLDGPPDLAVEIVSPDSRARDWREKFYEYQSAGVAEYWIIDPSAPAFEAYELIRKSYRKIEPVAGRIESRVVKGFWLDAAWLWKRPLPKVSATLKRIARRK